MVSPAPARLAALANGWPSCRLPELSAVLPTAGAVRRPAGRLPAVPTAAPIGAAHPDRLPPVEDLRRPEPPPRVFTAPGIVPG
ncbi:MAG: hypothetical protein KH061_04295 [Faecalibacterium prausnitzii]|nr:hypothetical protein [Faecalibacterium prausnitzii]